MPDRSFVNIGTNKRLDFFIPRSIRSDYPKSVYLGAGTFGIVYGFEHKSGNGDNITVKKLIGPFEKEKRAQRCFRELQLLSEIDHENIIKVKFAYTTENSLKLFESVYVRSYENRYFATEYCGQDLNAILAQETLEKHSFSFRSFQKIISELLRALKYLNSANVIHRDLKPDNLAINENGKLTLLDFGLARVLDENNQHTNDPGMKYYRAIETIAFGHSDRQIYNEKADIWSIGAILCEMLTGAILFKTDPPASDVPIVKALAICGPIPENVIVEQVDEERSQNYLRDKSKKAIRIDFLEYFREKARPWLKKEIAREGAALANFIDRTLDFDHRTRMSVEEALSHPFLAQVRRPLKEVTAKGLIVDVGNASIQEWKERVWDFIQNHPIRVFVRDGAINKGKIPRTGWDKTKMYQASATVVASFFNGKVVIVTGSSVGIGRETARRFSENGAKVTLTGRNIQALQETERFCIRSGAKIGDIHIVVGDLNLKETQDAIVNETIKKFGKLDVLVNNAGAMIPNMEGKRGIDIPDHELRAVMDNNLFTMVSLTRLAVPHLEVTKGAIVNVSSIAAQPHLSKDFYYNISKAAVDQLTTQLAGNLIVKGIRVNSVNPGATATEFVTRHTGEEVKEQLKAAWETPDIIPIGRMGKVEDIAKIILFLADRSQSEFIIGQHIIADGGSSLLNNLMCAISVF